MTGRLHEPRSEALGMSVTWHNEAVYSALGSCRVVFLSKNGQRARQRPPR
jgi:hypothetical protein